MPTPIVASISSPTVLEGQALVFQVAFSEPTLGQYGLKLGLGSGTSAGFNLSSLEVSFDGGTTYQRLSSFDLLLPSDLQGFLVRVNTAANAVIEADRKVVLTAQFDDDPTGTVGTGTGTVLDDDTPRNISYVSDGRGTEGDAAIFTIELDGTSGQPLPLQLQLVGGAASTADFAAAMQYSIDGGDTFIAVPADGRITVPANVSQIFTRVALTEDRWIEGTETFTLNVTANGVTQSGMGVILDNEFQTVTSISSTAVREGEQAVFDVQLGGTLTVASTIRLDLSLGGGLDKALAPDVSGRYWVSLDGGATYTELAGSDLTVPAGTDRFKVRLQTVQDALVEYDEALTLNARWGESVAAGSASIVNDDLPTIDISNPTAAEGEAVDFTVSLTPNPIPFRLRLELINGSAAAPGDFQTGLQVSWDGGRSFVPLTSDIVDVPADSAGFIVRAQSNDDRWYEGNEDFYLRGNFVDYGVTDTGRAVLTDEADAPRIASVSSPSVLEGEPLVFAVALSNPSTTPTAIHLALNSGTAIVEVDVNNIVEVSFDGGRTYTPGRDQWVPAGVTDFLVRVASHEDVLVEYNETFELVVNTRINAMSGTGTIVNDDLPTIDVSDPIVAEGAAVDFNVALTPNPIPFRVKLELINGSAAAPADFQSGLQISWDGGASYWPLNTDMIDVPANSAGFKIRVQSAQDDWYEGNEDFYLRGTFVDYGVTDAGRAVLVDDADIPKVAAVSSPTVMEGDLPVFAVSLSNPSVSATAVRLALSSGTATIDQDFYNAFDVSWDGGATYWRVGPDIWVPAGVKDFLVRTYSIEDLQVEHNETFQLTVSANGTAVAGTGTIVNDDLPTIDVSDPIVVEGAAVDFNVAMAPQPIPLRMKLELINGSAAAPWDFQSGLQISWDGGASYWPLNSDTIDVPANSAGFKIRVQSVQDDWFEGNEDFYLRGTFVDYGVTDAGRAVLVDDADVPRVAAVSSPTVMEGDLPVFAVSLSNPSVSATAARLALSSGSATIDQDFYNAFDVSWDGGATYWRVGPDIWIPAGVKDFLVRTYSIEDLQVEHNETFQLTVSANGTSVAGTGTIVNDDLPTIDVSDPIVAEGAAVDFNVGLVPQPIQTRVKLELINGSAAAPWDFQTGLQISWDGGRTFATLWTDTIDVPANSAGFVIRAQSTQDDWYEGNEDFYLRGTYIDYGVTDAGRAVLVDDADVPKIAWVSSPTVTEGEMPVFVVSMSNPSVAATAVRLALASGTAAIDQDFYNAFDVSWDGGATYWRVGPDIWVPAGVKDFLVRTYSIQDAMVETDETFQLTVSANNTWASGTGTIRNDDAPVIDVSDPVVAEGAAVDFTVAMASQPVALRVQLDLANGSAWAGSDFGTGLQVSFNGGASFFTPGSNIIDVPANTSGFVVRVQSWDDGWYEGNEDFYLRATYVDWGGTDAGRAVLVDDADVPQVVSVSSPSADEGNHLVFNVGLSKPSVFATTVGLAVEQGSALLDQDFRGNLEVSFDGGGSYWPFSGQVSVPPGTTNFLIRVGTINDTLDEWNEDMRLVAWANGGVARGTGTIIDNDYTPTVSIGDASIVEGDSGTRYMNFTVTRGGGSAVEVSGESWVDYATSNISAAAGVDYGAASGRIHFGAWETSKTISVPIYGDTRVEADEQFRVTLSNASQAVIGNGAATGTIVNDDANPTIAINDIRVIEPTANHEARYVSFTVSLSKPSSNNVSFNWATRDGVGSAESNEPKYGRIGGPAAVTGGNWKTGYHDYDAASGNVVIPAGETSATVTVIIRGDDDTELDQSFYVDLSSVSNVSLAGSKLTGTCTIAANTSPLVLDLNGDGVRSVGLDAGVMFDNEVEGIARKIGWVQADDGLLARDLNGDGLINDGAELFGNGTQRADGGKAADGFAALAELDDNGDGMVDGSDKAFADLRVWRDADTDGVTDAGELLTLQQAGVAVLHLAHQASDHVEQGNAHALQGSFETTDGQTREMTDVFFGMGEAAAKELIPIRIPESMQPAGADGDDSGEGQDWVIPGDEAAVLIRGFDESADRLVLGDVLSEHPDAPLDRLLNFRVEGNNTVLEIHVPDAAPRQVILAGVAFDDGFNLNALLNQGRVLVD